MRSILWFRMAAGILLLFAVGHTIGFLTFRPVTADGLGVWTAMNNVHFGYGSGTYTYAGFYVGFGLFVTAFQIFNAWLALILAGMARRGVSTAATIAWGLVVLQLISAVLALRFFFGPPVIMSMIAGAAFAMAAISARTQTRSQA